MKCKKIVIAIAAIVMIGLIAVVFTIQNTNGCGTLENRERRLREISNLGEDTTIGQEIIIDGYIISGYTTGNSHHGLAVFTPTGKSGYTFQTNTNRQNDELVFTTVRINKKRYQVFWANKVNLDYAEITYTIDGKREETLKIDAQNNQILYTEAPAKDFFVEYYFVDQDGLRYG